LRLARRNSGPLVRLDNLLKDSIDATERLRERYRQRTDDTLMALPLLAAAVWPVTALLILAAGTDGELSAMDAGQQPAFRKGEGFTRTWYYFGGREVSLQPAREPSSDTGLERGDGALNIRGDKNACEVISSMTGQVPVPERLGQRQQACFDIAGGCEERTVW
jgi:hypothetical protein